MVPLERNLRDVIRVLVVEEADDNVLLGCGNTIMAAHQNGVPGGSEILVSEDYNILQVCRSMIVSEFEYCILLMGTRSCVTESDKHLINGWAGVFSTENDSGIVYRNEEGIV